jgi:hypothetical protein
MLNAVDKENISEFLLYHCFNLIHMNLLTQYLGVYSVTLVQSPQLECCLLGYIIVYSHRNFFTPKVETAGFSKSLYEITEHYNLREP